MMFLQSFCIFTSEDHSTHLADQRTAQFAEYTLDTAVLHTADFRSVTVRLNARHM